MSEAKKLITRWSRDFQGNLQEDPNGSWVLAADAAIRDKRLMDKIDQLQQRLTAADERVDVLEADVREKECLLLKCMEAFNNCVGMSSQATRSKWYEVYLKPVSGSVLVHFSKGIQRAFGKPAESDDTTIEEERDDAKKVFVRTNTKQGQSISLDDMLARYERKP